MLIPAKVKEQHGEEIQRKEVTQCANVAAFPVN